VGTFRVIRYRALVGSQLYEIESVDRRAKREHEQMGSKLKFWYQSGAKKWLYKLCRPDTGEDWAEKVAAEVAALLGLPHAHVELAESEGKRGCVSLDFVGESELIHGNELLLAEDPQYPAEQFWRVRAHTVENVLRVVALPGIRPPGSPESLGMDAAHVFVGYLALDALVGNTDRHHENWGLLRYNGQVALAPTYDHASSLGRELLDEKRRTLLTERRVAGYARKARSALYADPSAAKPLSPLAAFLAASARVPGSQRAWMARVASVSVDALREIIQRVHPERMSGVAQEFACQLLLENQRMLCAERPTR